MAKKQLQRRDRKKPFECGDQQKACRTIAAQREAIERMSDAMTAKDQCLDKIKCWVDFHNFKRRSPEEVGYYTAMKHVEQILDNHNQLEETK
jgi:hypothetical protein